MTRPHTERVPVPDGTAPQRTRTAGRQSGGVTLSRLAPVDAWFADWLALVIASALAVVVLLGIDGVARVLLALGFVTYVPGRAVVANWPAAQARSQLALPVILSLSIVTLSATIGLWLQAWEPIAQLAVLTAASIVAISVAIARRVQARPIDHDGDVGR